MENFSGARLGNQVSKPTTQVSLASYAISKFQFRGELKPKTWKRRTKEAIEVRRWLVTMSQNRCLDDRESGIEQTWGNCGMYVLKIAEFLMMGLDIKDIKSKDMPMYRKKMVTELVLYYNKRMEEAKKRE